MVSGLSYNCRLPDGAAFFIPDVSQILFAPQGVAVNGGNHLRVVPTLCNPLPFLWLLKCSVAGLYFLFLTKPLGMCAYRCTHILICRDTLIMEGASENYQMAAILVKAQTSFSYTPEYLY